MTVDDMLDGLDEPFLVSGRRPWMVRPGRRADVESRFVAGGGSVAEIDADLVQDRADFLKELGGVVWIPPSVSGWDALHGSVDEIAEFWDRPVMLFVDGFAALAERDLHLALELSFHLTLLGMELGRAGTGFYPVLAAS